MKREYTTEVRDALEVIRGIMMEFHCGMLCVVVGPDRELQLHIAGGPGEVTLHTDVPLIPDDEWDEMMDNVS